MAQQRVIRVTERVIERCLRKILDEYFIINRINAAVSFFIIANTQVPSNKV